MKEFDYVIIGGGCAGLSLAYELEIHKKLEDKTLAIITGIEGTSKVLDFDENNLFPEWFDQFDLLLNIHLAFELFGVQQF